MMIRMLAVSLVLGLSACAPTQPRLSPEVERMYAARQDGDILIPAVPQQYLVEDNIRRQVDYPTTEKPGTIVVDTGAKYLYLVEPDGKALRYRVAVGKEGKGFAGRARVAHTRDWPYWTPTANMLRSDPALYGPHRGGMKGGLENPLGARALYLYRNGQDTRYRIHGTAYPSTIGHEDTAGCIRLYNQDIIDLEERVSPGNPVIVLPPSASASSTAPLPT